MKKGRNQTFSIIESQVRDSTTSERTVTITRKIIDKMVCGTESRLAMTVENPSCFIESWKLCSGIGVSVRREDPGTVLDAHYWFTG
jgi:hypothetical protein